MAFYAAYHQNRRNKATHFIGVPAIMLSLFIPLAWIKLRVGGLDITGATVLAGVVLIYYVFLDAMLALATAVLTAALVVAGAWLASLGTAVGWSAFAAFFIGGWILQL